MKLRLEKWYSTENRHEEHFFLQDGGSAGYQESAYVFGYNPEIISQETLRKIIELIEAPNAILPQPIQDH